MRDRQSALLLLCLICLGSSQHLPQVCPSLFLHLLSLGPRQFLMSQAPPLLSSDCNLELRACPTWSSRGSKLPPHRARSTSHPRRIRDCQRRHRPRHRWRYRAPRSPLQLRVWNQMGLRLERISSPVIQYLSPKPLDLFRSSALSGIRRC